MELHHIKLTNGEDLLSYIDIQKVNDINVYVLRNPISLYHDIDYGYICRNWTGFSKTNNALLFSKDILFLNPASDTAEEYYYQFIEGISEQTDQFDGLDPDQETEQMRALIESRNKTKH